MSKWRACREILSSRNRRRPL